METIQEVNLPLITLPNPSACQTKPLITNLVEEVEKSAISAFQHALK